MLEKRRYKLIDGRLRKRWDATNEPGWFKTKAEALQAQDLVDSIPADQISKAIEVAEINPEFHKPEVHTVKRRPGRPRKNV